MAIWVTPRSWVDGSIPTAADLDAEIRDPLTWLKSALDNVTDDTISDTGTDTYFDVTRAVATDPAYRARVAADTFPRATVRADGAMALGPGDAAPDARVSRLVDTSSGEPQVRVSKDDEGPILLRVVVEATDSRGSGLRLGGYDDDDDADPGFWVGVTNSGPEIVFKRGVGDEVALTNDAAGRLVATGDNPRLGMKTAETGLANALFFQRDGDDWPRALLGQRSDGKARLVFSAGTASTADAEIYRDDVRVMAVPDAQFRVYRDDPENPAYAARVTGDSESRLAIMGGGVIDFKEVASTPNPPGSGRARMYARDNGSGKTQIVAVFDDGSQVAVATQP